MTQYKKANEEIRDIAAKLAAFQSQPLQDIHEATVRQYLNTLQSHSAGMSKLEQKASEKDPNKQIYNSSMVANILSLKSVFDQTLQECTALYEKVKVIEQEKAQQRSQEEEKTREQMRLKAEAEERERVKLAEEARLKALAEEQERTKAQEAEKAQKVAAEEAAKKEKEAQQATKTVTPSTTTTTPTTTTATESAVRMHIADTPRTLEEAARAIDALKDRKAPQDEVKAAVQTYLAIKERTDASTSSSSTALSSSTTQPSQAEATEQARRQEEEKKKAEEARKTAEEAATKQKADDAKTAEDAAKKAREDAQKAEAQRIAASQQQRQEESKTKEDVQTQGQKRKLDSGATPPELAGLELEEGLRTLASNSSREEYSVIVSALLGYVSNIVAAPMDSRFYKIKAHPLLQRSGGTESLHAIGFRSTDVSDQFEMIPSAAGWPVLLNAKKTLERAKAKPQEERKLPTLTPSQPPASQASNPPQAAPSQSQPPNLSTLLHGLLNPAGAGGAGQRPPNPLGSVLQNPAIQQLMSNPQAIQQALQQVLGGLGGLAPPTPTTPAPVPASQTPQSTTSTQTTTAASTTTPSTSTSTTSSTTTSTTTATTSTPSTTTARSAADDLALSEEEMIAEAIRMSMEEEHSK